MKQISLTRQSRLALIGCVLGLSLGAFWLRAWGAGWSLPYVDHPDEPAVVNQALRMVEGRLSPDTFFYPTLVKYLLALVLHVHFWWGVQTGLYSAPLILPRTTDFYTTIPEAYIWGRLLTAVLGTGAVVALAVWGGRLLGWWAGSVGAALLALAPWAIIHSHYIAVDIPAALTGTLALLAAVHVLRYGDWSAYLLAGTLVGLAAGTKYQNALVAMSVVLAHACHWWHVSQGRQIGLAPHAFVRLASAGLLSIVVFLLTSPYIVLHFDAFRRDFYTLIDSYGGSRGDISGRWPLWRYIRFLWDVGLQPVPFSLMLVGIVALVRRSPATVAVLLAFPLALLVTLLRMETHFFRNVLPAQPILMLFAGVGAVALWEALTHYVPTRVRPVAATTALLLLLLPLFFPTLAHSAAFARPDSRVAAQEWVRREWPGTRVASELSHFVQWAGVSQSTYAYYLPLRPLAWYQQQGYGLLLASSDRRRRWDWTEAYTPFLTEGTLVATFGGERSAYRGPRIDLIATGLTSETLDIAAAPVSVGPLQLLAVTTGNILRHTTGPELVPGKAVVAGTVVGITAFWQATAVVPPADYIIFVHLRDAQGRILAQRDTPPWQGLFPPDIWPPGELVVESLDLPLPDTLTPGAYQLVLGLYDGTQHTRFPAFSGGTRLPADEVDLGTIEVTQATEKSG